MRYVPYPLYLLITTVLLLEAGLAAIYSNDQSYRLSNYFLRYYMQHRNVVQQMAECSTHDFELSYILRSGQCEFGNREFSTVIASNSLGLRDDEASLTAPNVVVLGDSHAMGWGVQQNETFADLLETQLNITVLNAGVSSYGTVRELKLLERIDLSGLQVLIIQYCENDNMENSQVGDLPIQTLAEYEALQDLNTYYPGKFLVEVAYYFCAQIEVALMDGTLDAKKLAETKANSFVRVLASKASVLPVSQIIAFEINGRGEMDSLFPEALARAIESNRALDRIEIDVLDLSKLLDEEHFYKWDDHMNAAGHKELSNYLYSVMSSRSWTAPRKL